MRFALIAARKDLRRRLADPAALVVWIGIPMAITGLMGLVAGGGDQTVPKAHVLVVDQDDSTLSNLLAGAGGGPLGNYLDIERVALDEGRRRIDAGDATALLILPAGFQTAVVEERPAELTLVTNPAQRILPGIVEEGLEIVVEGVFYFQRLFGEPLRRIAAGASGPGFPTNDDVAAISTDINQRITGLGGVLFPPVLSVEFERAATTTAAAGFNFGRLFLPGALFMSILFIAQGMSLDVWKEKDKGTLRRTLSAPQPIGLFLAGKLLAGTALATIVALVGLLFGVALFEFDPLRAPLALLWCSFASAALLAFFLLVQMVATNQRAASVLGTMLVFPLMMIGGSFFPFEAMPAWMAAIGRWTPNGLAVVRLKDLLFNPIEAGPLAAAALGIGLPAALAVWLGARRLAGRFAIE